MIAREKEIAAIKALQSVIIRGRTMAHEGADHRKIADLLDRAEYLAALIYRPADMTDEFREYLAEFASIHGWAHPLTIFDTNC